ncbi:MAG: gliding motility lipoprotein GldH [Bacteroidota bacterium]
MKRFKNILLLILAGYTLQGIAFSCTTIDLYEKNVTIPKHSWSSSFKPEFTFTIADTSAIYQLFLVLRHTEKYNFNNIWINLYSQPPGDTIHKAKYELPLATNDKGWLGTGMDDIYEHRIPLTDPQPLKAGNYKFVLEQIMREDPLENVLNVGLRVEKK